MKENIRPSRNHHSYQVHRRQFWAQIFLPMILAVLLIVALAVITGMAAFGANDNSPIWAAISTIWLVIPVMFFGFIFLIVLVGLVYLLAKTLNVLPPYASTAHYYVNRVAQKIKQFSDIAAKPVLFIEENIARLKAIFGQN